MKAIIKILTVTLMLTSVFSCKKSFLDLHSREATDARVAIVDINSMRYAVNGVYALLQNAYYYNRTFYFIPELISDNVYLSRVRRTYYTALGKFTASSRNDYVDDFWMQAYRVIVNSNFIIQEGGGLQVPNSDTAERNAIIGEAYAIRALADFDLCRMFAQPYNATADASQMGIPLVLKSSLSVEDVVYPKRSTVKETYDAIVSDFKKAITMLPTRIPGQDKDFKGMITQNAAKALLSRVYLYMENWEGCKEMATDVIDSKQYALLPGSSLVSKYSDPSNDESIFEIVNTFTDNSGSSSVAYYYNQSGYGDGLPTWNLYHIYAPSDVRRNFMKIGDRTGKSGEKDVPLVTKFSKMTGNFEQDVDVIRLAEVYLNRAEAEAHLGEDDGAIADLAKIAQRADPAAVINPVLAGQALVDRILLERRKELAFEGQRLFDLTRNKLDFIKYYAGDDSTVVSYPFEKAIFPIPQTQIDLDSALVQNPGY